MTSGTSVMVGSRASWAFQVSHRPEDRRRDLVWSRGQGLVRSWFRPRSFAALHVKPRVRARPVRHFGNSTSFSLANVGGSIL
jgi:hypothetical protein